MDLVAGLENRRTGPRAFNRREAGATFAMAAVPVEREQAASIA